MQNAPTVCSSHRYACHMHREPVFTPRACSRRHQGKWGHWPVMATRHAQLGLHPHWADSWGRASTESAAQAIPQGCMLPEAPPTESDAGSQTGILCYTAEAPCPGAILHLGTRLIGVGARFAAPPEAHPKRRHRNDGDDIAWRIEPSQLKLVRTLPHRPRRSLWARGLSDNS